MRSLLFVPGDSEKKLAKGLGCCADVLLVDLEDQFLWIIKMPPAKSARPICTR